MRRIIIATIATALAFAAALVLTGEITPASWIAFHPF